MTSSWHETVKSFSAEYLWQPQPWMNSRKYAHRSSFAVLCYGWWKEVVSWVVSLAQWQSYVSGKTQGNICKYTQKYTKYVMTYANTHRNTLKCYVNLKNPNQYNMSYGISAYLCILESYLDRYDCPCHMAYAACTRILGSWLIHNDYWILFS